MEEVVMSRHRLIYVVLLAFSMVFARPAAIDAALVIEPALINLKLSQKRASGVFFVRNTSDTEERYRAATVHFTVTRKGGLSIIPSDEYSLAQWIKFNPTEFVLPPKSSRMVRYAVIPRGKLKPREYWGAIQFVPLKGKTFQSAPVEGRSVGIEVVTVILVPIYGLVEGTEFSGQMNHLSARQDKDGLQIGFIISNTGEGVLRLSGGCQIIDPSGNVVKEVEIEKLVVFPHAERIFTMDVKEPLLPNSYTVRIALKSANAEVALTGETNLVHEKE